MPLTQPLELRCVGAASPACCVPWSDLIPHTGCWVGWGGVAGVGQLVWCPVSLVTCGSMTLDLGLTNLQLPHPLAEKIREATSRVCHEEESQ